VAVKAGLDQMLEVLQGEGRSWAGNASESESDQEGVLSRAGCWFAGDQRRAAREPMFEAVFGTLNGNRVEGGAGLDERQKVSTLA
jgi:hypothetical protein